MCSGITGYLGSCRGFRVESVVLSVYGFVGSRGI